MKKLTLIISLVLTMMLTFAFTACGDSSTEEAEEVTTDTTAAVETEEDGQNPVMNYVGYYSCDRALIFIEAEGNDTAKARVAWGGSATENTTWEMSGTFDTENLKFEYDNCVKTNYVYDEDGNVESQEEEYTDGTGSITFTDSQPLTLEWQDDVGDAGSEMVFTWTDIT